MKHLKSFVFLLLFSIVIFSKTSFASETELQVTDKNHILIVDSTNDYWANSMPKEIFCPFNICFCRCYNNVDMWGYVLLNNNKVSVLNLVKNGIYQLDATLHLSESKYNSFDEIAYGINEDGTLRLKFEKSSYWEMYKNNGYIDYGDSFYINIPISLRAKTNKLTPSIINDSVIEFKKISWEEVDKDGFITHKNIFSEIDLTFVNNLNEKIFCEVQYSPKYYSNPRVGYNTVSYIARPYGTADKEFYGIQNGSFKIFLNKEPEIKITKNYFRVILGGQDKKSIKEYQYKINDGKWVTFTQNSQFIKNLKPNTKYKLKVRQIKTKDHPEVILFNKTIRTKKK